MIPPDVPVGGYVVLDEKAEIPYFNLCQIVIKWKKYLTKALCRQGVFMERIKQILKYGFFGFMTTVVNYGVFYVLLDLFFVPYGVANAVALIASVAFAFVVNKQFVFASKCWTKEVLKKELPAFLSARAVSGLIDLGSMWLLVDALAVTPKLAKVLVNVLIITLNYLFSKIYVFRKFAKR